MLKEIVEEDVSFTQKLFNINSNPTDSDIENLIQSFSHYLQRSKNDYKFFLNLIENFSLTRPKHKHIVPKLYEKIISFFPTNKTDIEFLIKNENEIKYPLLYILCYPNVYHCKEEETELKLFSYLEKDDIELLISFLSQHPEIDIHKNIELTIDSYYYFWEFFRGEKNIKNKNKKNKNNKHKWKSSKHVGRN